MISLLMTWNGNNVFSAPFKAARKKSATRKERGDQQQKKPAKGLDFQPTKLNLAKISKATSGFRFPGHS